jgi:hypothetical protein
LHVLIQLRCRLSFHLLQSGSQCIELHMHVLRVLLKPFGSRRTSLALSLALH